MKTMGQVAVFPSPRPEIARISELAYNLKWSWDPSAQALYRDINSALWQAVNHNPVKFLRQVSQADLDRAAADPSYVAHYHEILAAFDAYMQPPPGSTWLERAFPDFAATGDNAGALGLIAYFSAEFGLHESLPIYSGGLGILSGDHCKTASDLGLPFVGVGFLYPQGYFQQRIDADGRQQALYEKLAFSEVPATPALGPDGQQVVVSVELPGRLVHAKVWRIQVGRIPIYLLDTDVEQNAPADRELSARLYGGDQEIRVSQEIVLGIGGVRALRALGLEPTVWHMNEGHAAFLQLERIREFVEDEGLSFEAGYWAAKVDALFTTHTPVPAGNDSFPFELMDRFFGVYWGRLGLNRQQFLDLGKFDYAWGPQFSMTVLALRTAGLANGVSKLHGEVSRRMWRNLWPGVPQAEVPIDFITNGVHTDSWLAPDLAALFDRYLGAGWREAIDASATWRAVDQIPDDELWAQHNAAKRRMINLTRQRVVRQLMRVGAGPVEVNAAAKVLDPHALTIGFARRFATYKRATLIFRDRERLLRILNNPDRPVQIVFAGKAHPADEPGKALIQSIYQFSRQPEFSGRVVFIEDYDANIARHMVAGVDVWLNTPRRPLEASGTSGEKAGLNGVPNFSVLDGWWSEGYDGLNGWAIGQEREYTNEAAQDEADALSMYETLENEIVPLFYGRDETGLPLTWLAKMRSSITSVAPEFSFDRMLKEYVSKFYIPCSLLGARVTGDHAAGANALADWLRRVQSGWTQVELSATGPAQAEMRVGQSFEVLATLFPGPLGPDDFAVELVYGAGTGAEPHGAVSIPMQLIGRVDGRLRYVGVFESPESGVFSYGVRVRPHHPNLPNPFSSHLVRWA